MTKQTTSNSSWFSEEKPIAWLKGIRSTMRMRDRPMIFIVSWRKNVRLIFSKCRRESEDLLRSLRTTDDRQHWFVCCFDRMSVLMGNDCVDGQHHRDLVDRCDERITMSASTQVKSSRVAERAQLLFELFMSIVNETREKNELFGQRWWQMDVKDVSIDCSISSKQILQVYQRQGRNNNASLLSQWILFRSMPRARNPPIWLIIIPTQGMDQRRGKRAWSSLFIRLSLNLRACVCVCVCVSMGD